VRIFRLNTADELLNVSSEFDQEIMVCARAEARQIVQAMYDMLSAELCACIFSYLIPHDTVEDSPTTSAHAFPRFPKIPILPARLDVLDNIDLYPLPPPIPIPVLPYPHKENIHPPVYIAPKGRVFHPDFISEAVALEAAKSYYRMNTFKVSVTAPQRRLRYHLEVDRFQFGLKPFNLIRRITLSLPAECCFWPWSRQSRAALIVNSEELDRLTRYGIELSTNLALIPLENRPTMEFTFMITMTARDVSRLPHWDKERYFLNMLMCVREIVYDTKKHGSQVAVSARSRGTEPVDISSLFPLSVEEWQKVRLFLSWCST
jgi:hypothetical protein